MPEALVAALDELTAAWQEAMADATFLAEFDRILREYAGLPVPALRRHAAVRAGRLPGSCSSARTSTTPARTRSATCSARPCSPADGQDAGDRRDRRRPARRGDRDRGGVLRARLHRLHGRRSTPKRQALNVARMQLLGADVVPVDTGSGTLKDAINEAFRDWVASVDHTAYLFGTAAGPHPFPSMVRDFARGIGDEARAQCLERYRPAARRRRRVRRRRVQRDRAVPRRSSTTRTSRSTASRPAATASTPAGTPRPSTPARSACCTAPAPTCSRTRTARRSSRTRSRPGSTTRASARARPPRRHRPGDVHARHRRRGDGRDGAARPHRGHHPGDRVRARDRRRACELAPRDSGPDAIDAGQPLRPRRQGHGARRSTGSASVAEPTASPSQ